VLVTVGPVKKGDDSVTSCLAPAESIGASALATYPGAGALVGLGVVLTS